MNLLELKHRDVEAIEPEPREDHQAEECSHGCGEPVLRQGGGKGQSGDENCGGQDPEVYASKTAESYAFTKGAEGAHAAHACQGACRAKCSECRWREAPCLQVRCKHDPVWREDGKVEKRVRDDKQRYPRRVREEGGPRAEHAGAATVVAAATCSVAALRRGRLTARALWHRLRRLQLGVRVVDGTEQHQLEAERDDVGQPDEGKAQGRVPSE